MRPPPCSTGGVGHLQRSPSDEAENDEIGEHSPDGSCGDGRYRPHERPLLGQSGSHEGDAGSDQQSTGELALEIKKSLHGVTTRLTDDSNIAYNIYFVKI